MKYHFGEEITKPTVQEEPWYADYTAACEVVCAGPNPDSKEQSFFEEEEDGRLKALAACKKYFLDFPGPPNWETPSDERLLMWIDSFLLSEKQIQAIRAIEEKTENT